MACRKDAKEQYCNELTKFCALHAVEISLLRHDHDIRSRDRRTPRARACLESTATSRLVMCMRGRCLRVIVGFSGRGEHELCTDCGHGVGWLLACEPTLLVDWEEGHCTR